MTREEAKREAARSWTPQQTAEAIELAERIVTAPRLLLP